MLDNGIRILYISPIMSQQIHIHFNLLFGLTNNPHHIYVFADSFGEGCFV